MTLKKFRTGLFFSENTGKYRKQLKYRPNRTSRDPAHGMKQPLRRVPLPYYGESLGAAWNVTELEGILVGQSYILVAGDTTASVGCKTVPWPRAMSPGLCRQSLIS